MCTVTWLSCPGGYELYMNRDERHTRGTALPPQIHSRGTVEPVRFLAPVDPDAGGTWIAANELGLTVCLLNHYPGRPPAEPTSYESRGALVMQLVVAHGADAVDRMLGGTDLHSYRPFTLLVVEPDRAPCLRRWNGYGAIESDDDPQPPITSSSFDQDAVVAARRAAYAAIAGNDPTSEALLKYHASHVPEAGAYSVCAHREDGGTKSLCRVATGPREIAMHYRPGPPCEGAGASVRVLTRLRTPERGFPPSERDSSRH